MLFYSLAAEIGDDHLPQFGSDLRPDAEPALEAGHRLVQQHAEPVDGLQASRFGGGQQRRFQRHIDNVGDDGMVRQPGRIGGQAFIAMHAKR